MLRPTAEARHDRRASRVRRRGFGLPVIVAMLLPLIIFVGALAISYQSSSTRRQTASFFTSYLALELAESAVAEAAHNMRLRDIFDVSKFGNTDDPRWPKYFIRQMIFDGASDPIRQIAGNPPRFPDELDREYRNIYVDAS